MKVNEISVGKEIKIGLPNFSNVTVRCDLKYGVGENELVNWDEAWDEVNRQLSVQTEGMDPSWMTNRQYQRYFKLTIKIPRTESLHVEKKEYNNSYAKEKRVSEGTQGIEDKKGNRESKDFFESTSKETSRREKS